MPRRCTAPHSPGPPLWCNSCWRLQRTLGELTASLRVATCWYPQFWKVSSTIPEVKCLVAVTKGSSAAAQRKQANEPRVDYIYPLHIAARAGHVEVVRVLLDHEAKAVCVTVGQNTPLHWAAAFNHVAVISLLLERPSKGEDEPIFEDMRSLCCIVLKEECCCQRRRAGSPQQQPSDTTACCRHGGPLRCLDDPDRRWIFPGVLGQERPVCHFPCCTGTSSYSTRAAAGHTVWTEDGGPEQSLWEQAHPCRCHERLLFHCQVTISRPTGVTGEDQCDDDRRDGLQHHLQRGHRSATYPLFVGFLILMSIIVMNLLVGLAVDRHQVRAGAGSAQEARHDSKPTGYLPKTRHPKMENQARSDATSEGNTTPSIVTDIVAQLAAALRDIVNPGQRDSDLPRYDGTYPAANFFQQYDDIADRAYLTGTKRLQKLPAQLSGEPLTFFRQLDLANKSYDQARQVLIDLYPGTVEVSFSKFLALKLTPQTTLQGYYKEKTAMGLQLNLPTDIILESLTEGLPTADQRLVRTVSPNTLKDWHDFNGQNKGFECTPRQLAQHQNPPLRGTMALDCLAMQIQVCHRNPRHHATTVGEITGTPSVRADNHLVETMCFTKKLRGVSRGHLSPPPGHSQHETVLDKLAHAKIFTNVDISSAFWQVEIEPSSRNLLAFVTLEGQYQFSRLPFGLKNLPQIYERALSQVIQKYELDFIAHYFDDFVIFSNTIEEHAQHIQKFFLVCQEENIKLNYKKCEFFKTQIEFLGYTIKSGTYTPQIKNLDVINAIKVPTNLKTLQSFLVAINVYNKFIPNYAQLRTPLNKLLKKDTTWNWDNQCQTSFEALKESLTSQPILHLFKEGLPCQLYCDASLLGIAGVLKQQYPDGTLYPVQFYSRALRPHEKNYTISELECLAIIECVDKFRVYLTGVKFTIFTDHHALQWLKTIKNPTGRLFRWSLKISTYEYEIRYIKGSKQHEADLLSRNPFCGFLSAAQIKEKQPLELPYPNATINPEGLHTLTRKGVTKVIVPPSLQHTLINKVHVEYNHPGVSQMTRIISTQYTWRGMTHSIVKYVRSCPTCQLIKRPKGPNYGTLGQLPPVSHPFDTLSIDTIAGFSKYGSSKTYLHVIVDHLSRYAWTFPSKSTSTLTYLQCLKKVMQSNTPKCLLSDRAPAFTSPKFRKFLLRHVACFMRTRSGLFYEMANADQQPLEAPTVEAGVTTGGDAGFDPIPFNPSLNIRKYAGDEDPRQWITSLEEVGFLYRWADYIITRYAAMNLVGPAKTWYEFHKVNLATWEIFKTRLIQDFASLENKDEMMLKLNRMQGWNELAMRFAEDILLQCSKVQPNMEEKEKIQFVIGGLKKEYALALYLNPPKTIDELLEACKRIDGFEKEYLERKEKNKILMNRISQKETNHARWNRQPREFKSYKTENYSRPMMGAPSQNQTYFPPQETRTFPRSTQKDTYRRTPSGNTYDRKPRNDRDGKRLNILGSISMDIKIDEKSLNHRFVVLESNMKSLIIGRDLLRRLNAKINCKQDILEYDIVTECQDSNEAPRKIINQQDEVVPQLCVKLVRVTVKANDGEYVVEPNEKLTLTNGLRIARCLITVRNKLADLWITNPYPRTLKIMKNQTLGYASPPTMVNNIEDDEEDKVTEIQINEDLTLSQKNELRQVLSKYSDLFSSKLGKTNLAKHRIDTENAKPIKHKPYRVSPKERDIIKEQIQDMLQDGVIRASSGPWAFPVILVRKRDGNWRFCVDYRKLNSITVKDVYPIPRIDDVMDTLQGSRYFTAIDLRSGYWQVEIEEQDKKKTAFTTSHGLYEFNVMPFGLCNAPATFERIMDNVLKNIKWKFCLCYLDDAIIYSPDFTTHLGRIEAVLKCFRESNLRLNGKKCRFGFEEIEILGHVTSKHGIKPADHNVKAIRDFPRPSKTKEIQSFIGLCSYYRKFIKNFSRIADPLFKLTRKDSPFIWSESQEEAFITLKSLLTNPPILSHFDPEAPTQIHTDASNIGLGATLVQTINGQEKVISYISRSLSKPERNYSTTEKECLALVWSMSKLRPYLYGRRFKVMTDHHALCWLRNLRDPTGRLARWALKIQEYDFEIIYKSGKKHLDADGLSRGPLPETDFDDNYDSLFFNPVIEDSDEYIENIKRCLGDTEGKRSIVENFKEENGCLYKRNPRPEGRAWLLVVPRVRRKDILKEHHNHMICGHLGVTRTMHRLKDKYFWPSMLKDVVEYVRTCHLCQSRKGSNQLPAGLLHPIPASNYPFERVGIDFLGPLPSTKNRKKWMIVLTDYYTKYAETKAVIDATASEVAKFLTENVILKHGAPRYLISDRGSQFTSNLVKEITKICQIQHCLTTSYHPQTNGLTERLNRTLINMISMYVNVDQRNWDEILPFITHAYNTTIQETTKYSPFFLLYGREPVSILDDTNIFIEPDSEDYDEYVSKLMEKIVRTRDIVKVNTEKSQAKMINYYNQKHRQTGYEPGDLVALWTPIRKPGKCEKLLRRYFGPYIVLKKISDVNYSIVPEDNPGNRTQPTTVHISRIKPYFARIEN
ncbi:K02A2.6-like, partial [Cordylochernes scorpioides]